MKQTKILLLITAIGITSCSTNGNKKLVLTSGIKNEFIMDSVTTKSQYVDKEVEVTGYFDFDEKNKEWEFNILDSNIHNQEDDSTDENTLVSDFANNVHGLRLAINTDLQDTAIASQHLISPVKAGGGYCIYDKSKGEFYSPEKWGNIAGIIQILSKDGGIYYGVDRYDSVVHNHFIEDLKINDTTIDMLDSHLKTWVKDITSIQHNDVLYCPTGKYQKLKIIDVVTIKGKISEIIHKVGNYEVVGKIDVLVLNLKGTKIVKKERIKTSDFLVLDYDAKKKMIASKQ